MSQSTVHGNSLVIGTLGLLLRGESGRGKSVLTDALIDAARSAGHFAALVADDRSVLTGTRAGLIASTPPVIAGLIEVRGHGIAATGHEKAACIRLVVDLVDAATLDRLPDAAIETVSLAGADLPLIRIGETDTSARLRRIRWAIRTLYPALPDYI